MVAVSAGIRYRFVKAYRILAAGALCLHIMSCNQAAEEQQG
jgi:hypothetical protein